MRQVTPTYELLRAAFADAEKDLPRYRVLYQAIRGAILSHQLPPGTRLPSTRELAQELGLSRNTVLSTFEGLLAEGFITAREGSGTYVAHGAAPPRPPAPATRTRTAGAGAATPGPVLSRRGERIAAFQGGARFEIQPICGGDADFSLFPMRQWQRLQSRQLRLARPELLDYSHEGGHAGLRHAIADYLRVSRAVRVEPAQVLITAGTQHSLDLCAHLLADAGDRVWVEDPCYWGARAIFESCELKVDPVAVDADGMDPALAPAGSHPRLVHLTPSNQYPTGVPMSLARRRAILDIATRDRTWILEDDYDSELRYAGRPLSSLQGLDPGERVIYLGTFSKVLYPGIKIGYLVVPPGLVASFRSALYDLQRPGQLTAQAALAEFIARGYYATHIRRLRAAYAQVRERLQAALAPCLGEGAWIASQSAGLHLVLGLPEGRDDEALAARARAANLRVNSLSSYYLGTPRSRGLVIGYGYAPAQAVEQAGAELARIVRAQWSKRRTPDRPSPAAREKERG
jgi:GntR family transcriptional regulator/MocR family aminotransferase